MLYMADTTENNPEFYLALYMKNGQLVLSMQTNTPVSRAPASPTKILNSTQTYDNGLWNKVQKAFSYCVRYFGNN